MVFANPNGLQVNKMVILNGNVLVAKSWKEWWEIEALKVNFITLDESFRILSRFVVNLTQMVATTLHLLHQDEEDESFGLKD